MSKNVIRFDDSSLTALLSFAGQLTPASPSSPYVSLGMGEFAKMIESALAQDIPDSTVGNLAVPATGLVYLVNAAAGGRGGIDDSALLTLKLDATGGVDRVYGPAMFAADDGRTTVIRIGKNVYPVAQTGTTISVGYLSGDLRFSTSSYGTDERLRVNAILKDAEDQRYEVSVVLSADNSYTQDDIEDGLASGAPLATYLRPLGAGGKFCNLRDLEPGIYEIAAVVDAVNSKFDRFKIELVDGRITGLNKALERQIEGLANAGLDTPALSRHYAGKFLWIISVTRTGDKSKVDARFLSRDDLDNTAGSAVVAAPPKPGLPPAPAAAAAAPGKDRATMAADILARFKAAGGPANAAVSSRPAADPLTADKYDDIPF